MKLETSELMKLASPVASIDISSPIRDAAREMAQAHVGSLVVTDGAEVVGLITDRDVALAALRRPAGSAPPPLESVTSKPLITIRASASIEEAAHEFAVNSIKRLGLVSREGKLVGVLSADCVLMRVGRLLGDLSLGIDRELSHERQPVGSSSSVFGSE